MSLRPLVLVASLATAPIQCGHETDLALRQDESPGDALWDLAQRFDREHDEAASIETLQYLVQRYPASRWAAAARERLGDAGGAPPAPGDGGG
jgi:hypothetical protein